MKLNRTILILALFTLVGFPLIGYFIFRIFSEDNWFSFLKINAPLYIQLPLGTAIGLVSAFLAWKLINLKFMLPAKAKYGNIIHQLKFSTIQIVYVSFCAGIGEELLFRASIQPLAGNVITSIGFVALHGYLNPMNWRICVYGAFMSLVIYGLGYCFEVFGIYTCIMAHAVIDIYLLWCLVKLEPELDAEPGIEIFD